MASLLDMLTPKERCEHEAAMAFLRERAPVEACWRAHNALEKAPRWQRFIHWFRTGKDEIDLYWDAQDCITVVIAREEARLRATTAACSRMYGQDANQGTASE